MRTQFSFNQITLIGNITNEPEVKYTAGELLIVKFGLATSHSFKKGDEFEQKTTFHNIVLMGKGAEWLSGRLKKGHKIMVVGRQEHNSFEGQDGVKRYYSSVTAETVTPLFEREEKKEATKPAQDNFAVEKEPEEFASSSQEDPMDIPF